MGSSLLSELDSVELLVRRSPFLFLPTFILLELIGSDLDVGLGGLQLRFPRSSIPLVGFGLLGL